MSSPDGSATATNKTENDGKSEKKVDKKKNKESEKDDGKDADAQQENNGKITNEKETKAEIRLEQIFDILGSLRSIISKSTNITLEEKDYNVSGYGPKAWIPKICENVSCRFEIIEIGRERRPYVLRMPVSENQITNIDSLLNAVFKSLDTVSEQAMVFIKEPRSMRMLDDQYIDPECIGFPYARISECNFNVSIIQNAIRAYLNPVRRPTNFNFSDGFVFRGTHVEEVMRDFFDVAQREMRITAETIDNEELRTRDGIPDSVRRPIYHNNVLFEVIVNPFILTEMFNEIPRHIRFSAGMVIELQRPSLVLGPIDSNTLQKSASMNMTRTSSISSLFGIDYTPDMSEAISSFIISLIVPGLIEFDIQLDDIDKNDHPMRVFCGLGAKLIFSFSEIQRWRSITPRSVRNVERAIADCGLFTRVFLPGPNVGPMPLDRIVPNPDANLRGFANLLTQAGGAGWREGAHQRYSEHPENMPYVQCCRLQRYVTDHDDKIVIEHEDNYDDYNQWEVMQSASQLLSALMRFGDGRASYTGTGQIFSILAKRIFEFFIVQNDYNRKNWYSSLRLSDRLMDELYNDGNEAVTIVPIKGKTILYLMKALSGNVIMERQLPYLIQVKAESALARDCVESGVKRYIFDEVLRRYNVPDNSFTSKERVQYISPKEGPLNDHLKLLMGAGLSSQIGHFYACVRNIDMYLLMRRIVDSILDNPIDFGIITRVLLGMHVADRSVRALTEYARNNLPYTNIGSFETEEFDERPVHTINLVNMGRFINTFNLQQTVRDLCRNDLVSLELPFSFKIEQKTIIEEPSGSLFKVAYDSKRTDNNLRHCLSWDSCAINIINIDSNELQRPDLYIKNFSNIDRMSIPLAEGNRILMPLEEWINGLNAEAIPCVFIRTDNVLIKSIFERI